MVFTIGSLDIVPFIGENGVKWTLNGIDSSDAGRAQNALMYRGLVGYKAKCEIACLWVKKSDIRTLLNAIMPEFVTVTTDTIPWLSGTNTLTMYSNNIGATLLTEYTDGTQLYGDLEFPLVER